MNVLLLVAFAFTLFVVAALWCKQVNLRREQFIRSADLPKGLFDSLRKRHPHLSLKDCQLIAHGLRQFFLAHLKSGRRFVSMPSQVVDDLWHEYILHTKNYELFCRRAFGRFLHHAPAATLGASSQVNVGLRRCWWHVCREENINPAAPARLPLLFALDAKLKVAGGFLYVADCSSVRRVQDKSTSTHCGGDFSDHSVDGSTEGFGDPGGSGSDAGSDGGGGDGCGGGGCGGGGD